MTNESQQHSSDSFDIFLSEKLKSSQPYIDDSGFSVQVMQSLPQTKKLSPWVVRAILIAPMFATFLALIGLMGLNQLVAGFYRFSVIFSTLSPTQLTFGLGATLLVLVLSWFLNQLKVI